MSTDLDSAKEISTKPGRSMVCWLKNQASISFNSNEYLRVTTEDPPGLWCVGRKITGNEILAFRGMLTREQMSKLEIRNFDYETSLLFLAPIVGVIMVLEFIKLLFGNYHL